VCPVKIPITDILRLLRNRHNIKRQAKSGAAFIAELSELMAWKVWSIVNRFPGLLSLGQRIMSITGSLLPRIGVIKNWTECRTKPVFASKSLKDMTNEQGIDNE
jgi:L-lactate utilization protein LutB